MRIEIDIGSAEAAAGADMRRFVAHHVRRALECVRLHVESVFVRIVDLNGPAGGPDKLCAVQVRIAGQRPVRVRDVRADARAAVAAAAARAGRTSLRRLRRRHVAAPF
jgi:hypothetical protein